MTTTKKRKQMAKTTANTNDPICGMTVDEATAFHAERDGETFYFCNDHCRQTFLSALVGSKLEDIMERTQ